MRRLALLPLLLAAAPAAAHGGGLPDQPDFDPWVVLPLALSWILYARGTAQFWRRAAPGRGVPRWRAACFAAGWASLLLALLPPLRQAGHGLFTAHMLEHELLMVAAAPLLVLGRPIGPLLWALPPRARRVLSRAAQAPPLAALWRALTAPLAATLLHGVALWASHLPQLFEAVLEHPGLHRLQHVSFLGSALVFWWAMLERRPRAPGPAFGPLFVTSIHASLLGALFLFAPRPWYPRQVLGAAAWGLSPLEDQQLGGMLMWVVGDLAFLAGMAVVVLAWMRHEERRTARLDARLAAERAARPDPG
jgi:putative membrane protein